MNKLELSKLPLIKAAPNKVIYIKNMHAGSTSFQELLILNGITEIPLGHVPMKLYIQYLGREKVDSLYSCCVIRDPAAFCLTFLLWSYRKVLPYLIPADAQHCARIILYNLADCKQGYRRYIVDDNNEVVVKELFPFAYLPLLPPLMFKNLGIKCAITKLPHVNKISVIDKFSHINKQEVYEIISPYLTKEYKIYNSAMQSFEEKYSQAIPVDFKKLR